MDQQSLLELLDKQDWNTLIRKLTLAAKWQLSRCRWSSDDDGNRFVPSATHPQGYALDAMGKVYEGCMTGTNQWNPERGDLYPFMERLVRRLVTDDMEKYSKGTVTFFDELPVEPSKEDESEARLNAVYEDADEDIKELILVLREQVDSLGRVVWSTVREELAKISGRDHISDYELNKRRDKLAALLEKHGLYVKPAMTARK